MRQAVRKWKAEQGCVDCGERNPDLLDCDHDGDEKSANISDIRRWTELDAELRKVVVRCVKCHRQVTAMRRAIIDHDTAELDAIIWEVGQADP